MKENTIKKRIYEILQIGNRSDMPSLIFDFAIVGVILLNIAITFLQTFDELSGYSEVFAKIEFGTMLVFVIEYGLRFWTADYLYEEELPGKARLLFLCSFVGIVDLLTFLPYFIPFFLPSGAVAFRMLRVVRILHLFRINANYDAFNVITDVIKDKRDQLISSIFLILVLMMASSLCMYSLEHDAQPENFANAFSGIWWSVSTLLTVGYGDIYPVTIGGQLMAIVIAFLGVGMVAIPTGIISAGFVEYYTKVKIGSRTKYEADFVSLEIVKGHPYENCKASEITLIDGLYLAAVLRGEDVFIPRKDTLILAGDILLLGTMCSSKVEATLDEVVLETGHPWIEKRVKDLDISRRTFLVMIKRKHKVLKPEGATCLKKDDVVLVLNK